MRKAVATLLAVALVVALGPAAIAAGHGSPCGIGEVSALAQTLPQMFSRASDGQGVGVECQFRFYDDNGPDDPHEFTTEDSFLGGIIWFVSYGKDELFTDRREAIELLDLVVDELYFGPLEDAPDLPQVDLTVGSYRDAVLPGVGHVVYNHRYAIFSDLEPGEYSWRWDVSGPFGTFGEGVIEIVEATP